MMNYKRITLIITVLFFCIGLLHHFTKQNTKSEPVKVAVIYAQNVKKQAIPFQKFEEHFNREKTKIHNDFLEREKELRIGFDELKKIKKQKGDIQEKKEILHQKVNELNSALQAKKEDFLKKIQTIEKDMHETLQEVIEKIIKKYGFNLVLNAELDEKTLVFYADSHFDITSEIIQELNKISFPFFTE